MQHESAENIQHEQYLTFHSAGEEYAIGILQVKEIIPFNGATTVPMAPPAIRGLINLRGRAVPVIDLAIKFGATETQATNRTCVIIADVIVGKEEMVMGILTDSVKKVIELPVEDIDEAPNFGTGVASHYLSGLAKINEEFIPIIDVENVLSPEEVLEAVLPSLVDERATSSAEQAVPSTEQASVES